MGGPPVNHHGVRIQTRPELTSCALTYLSFSSPNREILSYFWYLHKRDERLTTPWRAREHGYHQMKWHYLLVANTIRMVRATCKSWRDMGECAACVCVRTLR